MARGFVFLQRGRRIICNESLLSTSGFIYKIAAIIRPPGYLLEKDPMTLTKKNICAKICGQLKSNVAALIKAPKELTRPS